MNEQVNETQQAILNNFAKQQKTDEEIIAEIKEHNKKTMHKILLDRQAEDKIRSVDLNETRYDAG